MVRREILAVLKANEKEAKSPQPERSRPPKLISMHFASTSTCMNFLSQFYFLTPMVRSMVRREILAVLRANKQGAKSPQPERPHPPKLISMHFTSTSTCMNFLSQFYFLTPCSFSYPSVLVLLEGVKENHEVHLEYLKYLSSLQAQCYDACLQVNAVQTVINR